MKSLLLAAVASTVSPMPTPVAVASPAAATAPATLPAPLSPAGRITGADIERMAQSIEQEGGSAPAGKWLSIFPNAQLGLRYRTTSGRAEMHANTAEIIFIRSGAGKLQFGGALVNPAGPRNEPRADTIEGGELLPAGAGDIFNVPPNTPHRFVLDPGQKITYMNIKIEQAPAVSGPSASANQRHIP